MIAQTVPPVPVITKNTPGLGQVQVTFDLPKCQWGNTQCGLSECGCWEQLWRAQCSSATSCPAPVKGSPFTILQSATITGNGSNDSSGGTTGMVMQDTDGTSLIGGSTWTYFVTANYAVDPNHTQTGPSNASIATIPGSSSTVSWSVWLDFDNSSCITGKTCSVKVYRALCSSACPIYPDPAFVQLPDKNSAGKSYTTQTVSASNTHFKYQDDGGIPGNLGNAKTYYYAVMNYFDADPSSVSKPAMVSVPTPTGVHNATLNYSNPGCNTTTLLCVLQVYRAQCTSATSCPTYPSGTWKALDMTGLTTTTGAQGVSWKYVDNDTSLKGSTTYSWVATNKFANGTTVSPPSQAYIGTTLVGRVKEKTQ